jgi:matrixin
VTAARADDAAAPATRWPAGGSTLRTALAVGAEHWGMAPCGGRVTMLWTGLDAGINAQSSWANDLDPYLQPSRNTECDIALSTAAAWDWVKLCSVVVHEVGHLTGHDHVDDPDDIMYYAYVRPTPECAAMPEPVETGAPPAAAAAPPRSAAKKASVPKRTTANRKAAKPQRKSTARRRHHG